MAARIRPITVAEGRSSVERLWPDVLKRVLGHGRADTVVMRDTASHRLLRVSRGYRDLFVKCIWDPAPGQIGSMARLISSLAPDLSPALLDVVEDDNVTVLVYEYLPITAERQTSPTVLGQILGTIQRRAIDHPCFDSHIIARLSPKGLLSDVTASVETHAEPVITSHTGAKPNLLTWARCDEQMLLERERTLDGLAEVLSIARTAVQVLDEIELPESVNHGDCGLWNLVSTSDCRVLLLDWDLASFGCPLVGLGNILLNHPDVDAISGYTDALGLFQPRTVHVNAAIMLAAVDEIRRVIHSLARRGRSSEIRQWLAGWVLRLEGRMLLHPQ